MEITHRDLTPENIFVDELASGMKVLKIAGFGISKVDKKMKHNYSETLGNFTTPAYIAPEVVKSMEETNKVDVWALGIILYELVTSRNPFFNDNINEINKAISTDPPTPILSPEVS